MLSQERVIVGKLTVASNVVLVPLNRELYLHPKKFVDENPSNHLKVAKNIDKVTIELKGMLF